MSYRGLLRVRWAGFGSLYPGTSGNPLGPQGAERNEGAGSASRAEHLPVGQQEMGHLPPGPGVPRSWVPSAHITCWGELLTRTVSTISFVALWSWKPRFPYVSLRPHFPWRALQASEPLPCWKRKEM